MNTANYCVYVFLNGEWDFKGIELITARNVTGVMSCDFQCTVKHELLCKRVMECKIMQFHIWNGMEIQRNKCHLQQSTTKQIMWKQPD